MKHSPIRAKTLVLVRSLALVSGNRVTNHGVGNRVTNHGVGNRVTNHGDMGIFSRPV